MFVFGAICKQVLIAGLCPRILVDELQPANGTYVIGKNAAREIVYINTRGAHIALNLVFWSYVGIILRA